MDDKTKNSEKLIEKVPESQSFEDCLEVSGCFGLYQLRLFIICTLIDISTGCCMYYFVFSNSVPEFRCYDREPSLKNVSETED